MKNMKKQPTKKQLEARKKLGELSKARAKARQTAKTSPTSDLKNEYVIVIELNDQNFTCNTNDIVSALEGFSKQTLRTRSVITIKKGNKEYIKILNIPMARALFNNNLRQRIFANGVNRFFQF